MFFKKTPEANIFEACDKDMGTKKIEKTSIMEKYIKTSKTEKDKGYRSLRKVM